MRSETDTAPNVKRSKYRPLKSNKPPVIKNAVVARRGAGQHKSQIARELGISRNTVNGIIEESKVDQLLADGDLASHRLIPKSICVIDANLDKNDLDAAKYILTNTVFGERSGRRVTLPDVTLNQALAVYISSDDKVTTAVTSDNKIVDPQK